MPKTPDETVEAIRIKGTFENYRAAVATGNETLEKALHTVLLRDRATALHFAEEALAEATYPAGRDSALKALNALRR